MGCTDPHGCTLGSTEMAERVAAWRKVSSRALSRELEGDRVVSVYPSDADVTKDLEDLIAAEAACCPFLRFRMTRGRDQTVVELTFPPEARPLVEATVGALVG